MKQITALLISLIGNEVCGKSISLPVGTIVTDELLARVFDVAKAHDVAHIVGSSLLNNNLLFGSAFAETYRRAVYDAALKSENQSFILEKISSSFEEEKICHIPLKGSVIKKLYPQSWLRTSRDIDILVREGDLQRAAQKLKSLGFAEKNEGKHDVAFENSDGICIELHFSLMEKERSELYSAVLDDVWNYAEPENNGFRYALSDDMFYFYHIAHMAKHFKVGGCGIRPFVDLWLIKNSKNYHSPQSDALLKQGGLTDFAKAAEALCEVWFDKKEHSPTTLSMEKYIIGGGAFGSEKTRKEANRTQGRSKFFLSRLFVSYDYLKNIYPILKKYKFLFPFFEALRIFSLLFGKKKGFRKKYIEGMKNISDGIADEIKALFEKLDI